MSYSGISSGSDLLSQGVSAQVPSALKGLTSVFGMGTGVTPSPLPPDPFSCDVIYCIILLSLCQSYLYKPSKLNNASTYLGQALDRLVSVSLGHYCPYTPDLSTRWSTWGLTSLRYGKSYLEGGFALRCLQRLSLPYLATQRCPWQNS